MTVVLPPMLLRAQWSGGPTGSISYTGGNVGIGTGSPSTRLQVDGAWVADRGALYVNGSDHGFIALNAPGTGQRGILFDKDQTSRWMMGVSQDSDTNKFYVSEGGTLIGGAKLTIAPGGNVGIGTTAPQYKLAVNGTIGAKEVIVTNTGWPDYVFKPGYRLRPLSEVGAYIQAHHHLPEIPSAAEVKDKGVSVGDMQTKLLAKIEELTLHMIQQDKENGQLRQRLAQLENRVAGR